MAGGKETPRQKMIGMMYLVLTALLALNITKEIIDAFVVINNGVEQTNKNFDTKNGAIYSAFEMAMLSDEVKTKPFRDKALVAKKRSEELCQFIQDLKTEIKFTALEGKVPMEQCDTFRLEKIDSRDNYDIPSQIMIGSDPGNVTGKAIQLKDMVDKYRQDMLALMPPKDKQTMEVVLKAALSTDDKYSEENEKMISWAWYNFYHAPVAAACANLSTLQNAVKNAESDVVGSLYKNVDASSFKFDKLDGRVIAESNYILLGDEYKADIFVAGASTTSNPDIVIGKLDTTGGQIKFVGDTNHIPVVGGIGKYTAKPGAEGTNEVSGVVYMKDPANPKNVTPFSFFTKYKSAKPAAAVSPDKMNVFYIGVENPITVSAAGVAPEDLVVNGGNCSVVGSRGSYKVTVKSGQECSISVGGKVDKGTKAIGQPFKFRIKRVPSPIAKFAGITSSGKASKGELMAALGCSADLQDFVYDLKFPLVSWVMSGVVNGSFVDVAANGPGVSGAMKELMTKIKPGQKLLIEQVKVQAPDGIRTIPGVTITIK